MVKIQVIMGSTRQGRFVEQPAQWIFEKLKEKKDVEAELIDLRDWNLPFFNESVSPSMNKGVYELPLAAEWAKKVGEADGYIIIAPEYNHGYSAVLKNALDYVYHERNNKPVGFVSYGGISGGTRSVQQLRQVVIELQMVPIRNGIHIPMYWNNLDETGNLAMEAHKEGTENFLRQLLSWAKNLKIMRESESK